MLGGVSAFCWAGLAGKDAGTQHVNTMMTMNTMAVVMSSPL